MPPMDPRKKEVLIVYGIIALICLIHFLSNGHF